MYVCGVATTKAPELAETKDRQWMGAGGARGRARGRGARGLSQPLSQCKHVLIEIRSSGYNSFADVAARPPLSFSLHRTPNAVSLSLRGVPLRTPSRRRPGSFPQAPSVSRLCFLSRGVPLVTRVCSLFDYALSVSRERGTVKVSCVVS